MSHFSVGKLLSHNAEGLRGEPFCNAENLSIEKKLMHKECITILLNNFMDKSGGGTVTVFHREMVALQYQKTSWGSPSMVQKFLVIEKQFA